MSDLIGRIQDAVIEKTSNTRSRAGHTIERVAKMHRAGVSHRAIAAQLSDNSASGQEYTVAEVATIVKLELDCQTKVGVTVEQTHALIADTQDPREPDPSDGIRCTLA